MRTQLVKLHIPTEASRLVRIPVQGATAITIIDSKVIAHVFFIIILSAVGAVQFSINILTEVPVFVLHVAAVGVKSSARSG